MNKMPGKCYGKWSITDQACAVCLPWCSAKCQEATKRRLIGEGVIVIENSTSDNPELIPEVTPTDYLIKTLDGRFEKQVMWGDGFCENKFLENGVTIVYVCVNFKSGNVKVISQKRKTPRIIKLESVEQVEELIKEIL